MSVSDLLEQPYNKSDNSVKGLNPGLFILFVYCSSRLLNIYILSDVSVSCTETIFKDLKIR